MFLLFLPAQAAQGAWVSSGNPICVEDFDQVNPQIISDGSAGAIISWEDWRALHYDLYIQRVSSDGSLTWASSGEAVSGAFRDQNNHQLLGDGSGGALLVWVDDRTYSITDTDIYAQRVDSNGNPLWTPGGVSISRVNNYQYSPRAVLDGSGGAIVTWYDLRNSSHYDIYAQKINLSDGSSVWTSNGIAVSSATGNQKYPKIIADGGGGAIIIWEDQRSGSKDIYGQRIDSSGNLVWNANGVVICSASGEQSGLEIVSDGAGGIIAVWSDGRSGSYDIYGQRINASGAGQWTQNGVIICNASTAQSNPVLVTDGSNGAIMAWEDNRTGTTEVYAQKVSGSGVMGWGSNGVALSLGTGLKLDPAIAADGSGGATVVWREQRGGSSYFDIYGQRLNASGTLLGGATGVEVCAVSYNQSTPQIVTTAGEQAIVVWKDFRTNEHQDIYARKLEIAQDSQPPANISGFTAVAAVAGQQIDLSWTNPPDLDFAAVKILRKTGSYPISSTDGTIVYDNNGTSYNDTGLTNEVTYYYRAYAYDYSQNFATGVNATAAPHDATPPAVVTAFSVGAPAEGEKLNLSWLNPTDADFAGVMIRRSTITYPSSTFEGTLVYSGVAQSYPDSGLTNGEKYFYSAFSFDDVGNYAVAPYSARGYGIPQDALAPGDVSGFTAVANAAGRRIDLSWTNPAVDFSGTRILRKTGEHPAGPNDSSATVIYDGAGISYNDVGLSNGTQYFYKAFAHDGGPNYAAGVTTEEVATDITAPSVLSTIPTNGASNVGVNTLIRVNFNEPMATAETESAFSISPNFSKSFAWTVGNATMIVTPASDLSGTTTFTATVSASASDEAGNLLIADYTWTFTTTDEADTIPPDNVADFTASANPVGNQVDLSWSNPGDSDFAAVMIRRSTSAIASTLEGTEIYNGPDTSYEDSGLTDGLQYHYRAFAYDNANPTNYAAGVTDEATPQDTTAPQIANFLAFPNPAGEKIDLSWNNPSNSDFAGVLIRRGESDFPVSTTEGTHVYNGSEESYTDASLTNGQTYYYSAFAYDEVPNYSSWETSAAVPGDGQPPTVEVTCPAGGEFLAGRSQKSMTWNATDNGTIPPTGSVYIYYSTDGGNTYPNTLVIAGDNSGSYLWTVPAIDNLQVRVKVRVKDDAGNIGEGTSEANFTIDSTDPDAPTINAVTSPTSVVTQVITGSKTSEAPAMEVRFNGGSFTSSGFTYPTDTTWSYTASLSSGGGGINNFTLRAKDQAGNSSEPRYAQIILAEDVQEFSSVGVTIYIPPGAATQEVTIGVTIAASSEGELPAPPPSGKVLNGQALNITGNVTNFASPITMIWTVPLGTVNGQAYYFDGSGWSQSGLNTVSSTLTMVTFTTTHLTTFAIFGGVDLEAPTLSDIYFDGRTIVTGDFVSSSPTITAEATDATGVGTWEISIVDESNNPVAGITPGTGSGASISWSPDLSSFSSGLYKAKIVVSDVVASSEVYYSELFRVQQGMSVLSVIPAPNPFSPNGDGNADTTQITYQLSQNANVEVMIFDITGALLWKNTYLTGTPGGQYGYNAIPWNGITGFGDLIGNGLYIAQVIATDSLGRRAVGRGKIIVLK